MLTHEQGDIDPSLGQADAERNGAMKARYRAFISYSHAADGRLAPALQSALQRFTKRPYQLRAINVFRDHTDLSLSPDLWSSIESALADSGFFILLASPKAAASRWVNKEITYWLENRSAGRLLIVRTDGEIAWDLHNNDFDRQRTTCIPEALFGVFRSEPNHLDLTWARRRDDLSLRAIEFRDAVATLAATLHGRPKNELVGEDVRQQQRLRLAAWSAGIVVALLAIAATVGAAIAIQERDEARRQARIAQAQRLGAQAELLRAREADKLPQSVLLAVQGLRRHESVETGRALRTGLALLPHPVAQLRHKAGVQVAELSPDNEYVASADMRGNIQLWHRGSHSPHKRFSYAGVHSLAFTRDGRLLVAAGADGVRVWAVASGQEVSHLEQARDVRDVAVTSDGRYLVTASSAGPAQVWEDWQTATPRKIGNLSGGYSITLALSRDDRRLAMVGHSYSTIVVVDDWLEAASGRGWVKTSVQLTHDDNVNAVAFHPGGTLVATASDDGTARLWDTNKGTEVRRVLHDNVVNDVAFSPDGRYFATASADKTARVWETDSGRERFRATHRNFASSVGFGAHGELLVTASWDRTARLWELRASGEMRLDHTQPVESLAFHPNGKQLATASWDGHIWDLTNRQSRRVPHGNRAYGVAFSNDGRYLVTAGASAHGGGVALWDAAELRELARFGKGSNGNVAFDARATRLAVAGSPTQIFDVPKGDELLMLGDATDVGFSPDGLLLATVGADGIRLYDADTGAERYHFDRGHSSSSLAFSPTGRTLATLQDTRAQLWNVETASAIGEPFAYESRGNTLAFDPEGDHLAVGTKSGTVHVWQLSTRREVAQLFYEGSDQPINSLAFSPDGRFLGAGGGRRDASDNSARLWLWKPKDLIEEACSRLTVRLSEQEWREYIGDEVRAPTCP